MIRNISYIRAKDFRNALKLRDELGKKGKIIAGGTDLIIEMRRRGGDGLTLIDIYHIKELKRIRMIEDYLVIGACTTHSKISQSKLIGKFFPLLRDACLSIGSPQIRARGTIGGNIVNASPCADTLTPLVALDAKCVLESLKGRRIIEIKDFVKSPYITDLGDDEILTEIHIPFLPEGARTSFIKLGRRNAMAISRINIACVLTFIDGKICNARLAAGSIMPKTQRIKKVEEFLLGKEAREEVFIKAGEIASDEMIKASGWRWSTPYKKPVCESLIKRALLFCSQNE